MFKPVDMQKIRIVALKSVSKRLVDELHELGLIEISKIPESELETNAPFSDYAELSKKLILLRSSKNILKKFITKKSNKKVSESKIEDLEKELKSLMYESSNIKNNIKKLNEESALAKRLSSLNIDFSKLKTSLTDYTIGTIPRAQYAKCVSALKEHKDNFKLIEKVEKQDVLLFLLHREDLVLDGLLNKFNFTRLAIPKEMGVPKEYQFQIKKEIEKNNAKLAEINQRLTYLANNYYNSINELLERYSIASKRSEIASRFAFSEEMSVIEGWIVKNKLTHLNDSLRKEFGSKIEIFNVSNPRDQPPVKLDNPGPMKTVEFFVKQFSLPNSREIDPTFLFFFTAPIFYGMIMGDVIYGVLSLIVSLIFLKVMKPKGLLLFTIRLWMLSAIPAMIFGVIFDEWMAMPSFEFFNYLGELGLPIHLTEPLYHGFSRVHNVSELIGLSALVGVIQLALGFALGVINEWNHNKKHAIAKLAWIGVDLGGTIAVMSLMFNMFPPETVGMYSVGVLIISAIVVVITEGVVGALEIPGLAGNILSYTRIAAVGIVGVILAEIINQFFLPTPGDILSIVLMLPILLILHSVNTLIVMVEALIQGGRLNIVEFQTKFMHGGGRLFQPFALKEED